MSGADGDAGDSWQVGTDLRMARQRLGWELPEVAAGLRIRLPFLQALEDGRIADLPGNAYAIGFLRTYAGALGLDADEMARRFRAEAININRKPELAFPAPVPERGVPAGAVVLLGVLLAIGGYIGWYRMSGDAARRVEAVADVPPRLAALVDAPPAGIAPAPIAAVPQPAPTMTAVAPVPAGPAIAAAPPATGGMSSGQAAAAGLPPGLSQPSPPVLVASAVPSLAPPTLAPVAVAPSADGGRMVLRARADAWVQVRDRGGQVLLNRVMRASETWPVPNRTNLLLTTGNAGGTDVLVDGVAAPGFGGPGMVRRDIPLDPDPLKAGRLPVQMASGATGAGASTPKPSAQ